MLKTQKSVIIKQITFTAFLLISSTFLSGCNLINTLFGGQQTELKPADIVTAVVKVIDIAMTYAGIVGGIFFIIGGLQYITSAGQPEKTDKAKKTVAYAAVGIIIVILAKILLAYALSLIVREGVQIQY